MMGDAKKRDRALETGTPWPRRRCCPVKNCGSVRITRLDPKADIPKAIAAAWGNDVICPIDFCRDCGAIWEPWPDHMPADIEIDDVDREPRDNCAYRKGSKESLDPDQWARLVAIAENWAEFGLVPEANTSMFHCHKGVPIKLTPFADPSIAFDYEGAGINPRDRTCTGFLRLVWALGKKSTPCRPYGAPGANEVHEQTDKEWTS